MNNIFFEFFDTFVGVTLDDILIDSKTFALHVRCVKNDLSISRNGSFFAKYFKFAFASESVR